MNSLGVAVQAKLLAIGALTPWAKAGVGAIASQARINTTYGTRGLELLAAGLSPAEALARLTKADPGRAYRQVGIVAAQGTPAVYTGEECPAWAGSHIGSQYVCQGNCLKSSATIQAMVHAFEETQGPLWERLLTALTAGQEAGGDLRGQQSAALIVVHAHAAFRGFNGRKIDLRVDDHPTPRVELHRLLQQCLSDPVWSAREESETGNAL